MPSLLGGVAEFADRFLLGYAIGAAAGPALEPFSQQLANDAWKLNDVKPPTIYTLITGVARGQINEGDAREWAHEQGFSNDAFDQLLAGSHAGMATGDLMEAWRRGVISDGQFELGLHRHAIEEQWWPALKALKRQLLSPAEAANARQQMFISADEQRRLAADYGIEPQDADVQFELAGLPPGVETGLEMLRRAIVDEGTFRQIVAEGHTKTKYTDDLLALRDRVLSAAEYATLYLKGWITQQEMNAGGALTGYTPAQMNLLYLARGRPATVHQIHIGYARGAHLPGAADEHDAILTSVKESDIRPEYGELLYAQRYTYPSAFVLRSLVESGALTAAEGETALLFSGWEPTFAHKVAVAWGGASGGTAADKNVTKAQTRLWTTAHNSYVGNEISVQAATQALEVAGVAAAAIPQVLTVWNSERDLIRRSLSAKELVKAYGEQVVNPATGAPWTAADATARLLELGYDQADAQTLLEL